MADSRVATGLWVEAQMRRCQSANIPLYVLNKGAYYSGTVLLKINSLGQGCQVLTQIRDDQGALGWMGALQGNWVAESEADAYIQRALKRDPDVWVIEIESRDKTNPFEGKTVL